jgi:hypothetical protein
MNSSRRMLCCAAAASLVGALRSFAQAPGKVYRVGYLNPRAGPVAIDAAFLQGMRELGYVTGRNLVIDYRCANNQMDLLQLLADELRLVLLASVELFPLPDVDTPRIERKFAPRNAAGAT